MVTLMSDINNIQNKNPELIPHSTKNKPVSKPDQTFDIELLKTVEKLEKMGSEMDQVMQASHSKNPQHVKNHVDHVGKWINNIAGMVENISNEGDKSSQNFAKKAVAQYDKISKNLLKNS